jgi:hypothetical protein
MEARPHDDAGERLIVNRNYFRNARIAIEGDRISITNRWGKEVSVPIAHGGPDTGAAGVVSVFVWLKAAQYGNVPYRKLLVVNAEGCTLAGLPALRTGGYGFDTRPKFESVWDEQQLKRLCSSAGMFFRREEYDDTEALAAAHPGAMRAHHFYAHPYRYSLFGAVAFFVVLIAVVLAVAAMQSFIH